MAKKTGFAMCLLFEGQKSQGKLTLWLPALAYFGAFLGDCGSFFVTPIK